MPRFILLLLLALLPSTLLAQQPAQRTAGPFTAPQRSVRSRAIDQQHVRLDLKFDWEKQEMKGKATHTLSLLAPASSIELDAAEMAIGEVTLATEETANPSQKLQKNHQGNKLTIQLGKEYPAGQKLQIAIDYVVTKPNQGAHFVIPDASEPTQPKMVWTQSEPEDARYWFPCFDSPNDRLTSEIVTVAPANFIVLSNGSLISKQENTDKTVTWHWSQTKSHSPYLMSVVAGDFEVLEQDWDGIPVLSYVPRGRLAEAARSFDKTPAMMAYFSERIGYRYPWPKYAQICVDEYGWGGMEHTSATTLNLNTLHDERAHADVSSINLVAHELAHQWWGDLLTCKDWGEIWLNESFATYFATLWTEHDEGWDEAAWARHHEAENYFGEDARYRRSIVNYKYNAPMNVFDSHAYPKGGRVLHMLRFELGDEQFWRALRRYAEVNQFRTVETADLRIAIEDATGQGLNWFCDQWLYHGGHPEFTVSWEWDAAAKDVKLTVKQTQKVDETTPLFRTSAEIEIALPGETLTKKIQITKPEETYHFQVAERPTRVCFDPKDWLLKKLTFSKSKEELLDQLVNDKNVICRLQAIQGLAENKADSQVAAALMTAAAKDPFWGIREEAVKVIGKLNGTEARKALISAAKDDKKSLVRRAAVTGLGNFADDESRVALKEVFHKDGSYYAAAEALRALLKIDRDNVRDLLVAALDRPSHHEVLLRAACDGLVELKDSAAAEKIAAMLKSPQTPERRIVLLGGLARLKGGDAAVVKQVEEQLSNDRVSVRRAAVESLVSLAQPAAIPALQARREKEQNRGVMNSIDDAISKLRDKDKSADDLRKEVDTLRKKNEDLENRLKKLEGKGKE